MQMITGSSRTLYTYIGWYEECYTHSVLVYCRNFHDHAYYKESCAPSINARPYPQALLIVHVIIVQDDQVNSSIGHQSPMCGIWRLQII